MRVNWSRICVSIFVLFFWQCLLTTARAQGAGVVFVQATANSPSGPVIAFSVSFPANTTAGDFILVAFDYDANSTPSSVTDSQGNIFTPLASQSTSPGATRSRVYYANNIRGGADTVTINLTAKSIWLEAYLAEYSGVNPSNPIDAQAGAAGNAGAVSSGSATTTVAGDVIFGFCIGDWNCTAGSGFTTRSGFRGNLMEDKLAASAGSYAATGTANNGWTMQMLALKPVSSGIGAPPAITSGLSANGMVGTAFTYQITATNTPTSYGAAGLPAGLSVNTATGLISGTPAGLGTSSVTLSATNGTGTGDATLTLAISAAPPVITSAGAASGAMGAAFTYQITGTNTPTSYGATGLPAGLSVSGGTGLISGTSTVAGIWTVSIGATNSSGTGNATLTLTIRAQLPVVTSAATASGAVGTAFSYQITATNAPTSYGATGLPAGLAVSSITGLISGTPTGAGTSMVTLGATNGGGTGTGTLTLTISVAPPVITSGATANGTAGSPFNYQVTATNSPTSYGATGLPAGLAISAGTGLISGAPTAAGTSTVTVSATNGSGTGNATLTLTIKAASPVITSSTTAGGTAGTAFTYQITATNTPTSYGATGLPAGLSASGTTGLISGTPTVAGTSTVTLSATNGGGAGNATLTLSISVAAPVITSALTANGTTGSAFTYQIMATNTPTSYAATGLPAGLSLNTGTGLISGTPTGAGTSTVTLGATNGTGTGNAALTLTVVAAQPVITSSATANGTAGSAFTYQITATNTPTSYGATGLPTGLSVNSTTGLISGTPTGGGTSTVTLSATNGSGTGNATMTLTIAASVSSSFVQAAANAATGPVGSYSLSFSANTTAGDLILVSFDYDTNTTPSTVSDSQGNVFTAVGNQMTSPGGVRSRVYFASSIRGGADMVTINLSGNSAWLELYLAEYAGVNQVTPIDVLAAARGTSGAVSSGNATTTVAGDVIYGFCIGDWNCAAGSGFATRSGFNGNLIADKMSGSAGSYAATGTANNGWTMQMVALKPASSGVGAPPVITSGTSTSGTAGSVFTYQITAANTPTSYGAIGLPAGLSVNSATGLISGTPTSAGTSTITLSATNGSGTGNTTLTLTVAARTGLVISTSALPNGSIGLAYSATLAAAGGTTPYTWTLIAGALPAGLSLTASSGAIAGTPTQLVTNTLLTFEVSDSSSPALTQSVSLLLTVASGQGQLITLSTNGKYLVSGITGKPVFLVGDDAFDLAVMLDSADVTTYLSDRASRGFNAIWVTTVDNGYQTNPPMNFFGASPFDGPDFTNEDPTYWANVDSVVTQASNLGITVFLQPFFVGNGSEAGYQTSLLAASAATLQSYGTFLGNRYKGYNNIVWLLGGDSIPSHGGVYSQLNILGAAIAAADPNHLMTLEGCQQCATNGYNSVAAFQAAGLAVPSWLSLNWAYPQYTTTVAASQNAYTQTPFLPPLAGENFYELTAGFTEAQLRFEIWSEVLSGTYLGRIFGNGAIWNFNSPIANGGFGPSPTWQSQLGSAGSVAQALQGGVFSSREHWLLVPDINHTVVTAGYGSGTSITTTARTSDGQTIISYIPNGNATMITVAMSQITSSTSTVRGWWFNPTTGATTSLGVFTNSGTQTFTAPDANDWVLVLDDASANLPAP
jgi:Protein of unknown function (DUF4038)/Putative collagen-binding domain of a collagenase/Putative Ig domain